MEYYFCKICGGDLQVEAGAVRIICPHCGREQTLPSLAEDTKALLCRQALSYRLAGEFTKAEGLYETLLLLDDTDAELYWELLLSRCGVGFVNGKQGNWQIFVKIPLAQPIMQDAMFGFVERYAGANLQLYKEMAQEIDDCVFPKQHATEEEKHCSEQASPEMCEKQMENAQALIYDDTTQALTEAIFILESIKGWKNADMLLVFCRRRLEELQIKQEKVSLEPEQKPVRRIRRKAILFFILLLLSVSLLLFVLLKSGVLQEEDLVKIPQTILSWFRQHLLPVFQ